MSHFAMASRGARGALVAVAALAALVAASGATASDPDLAVAAASTSAGTVSSTVVIERGGTLHGYAAAVVTISPDGTLSVVNNDGVAHTVTSVALGPSGLPLFDTRVEPGQTKIVAGATGLAAGDYPFYCRFHPNMQATLVVEGEGGEVTPTPPSFDQPLVLPPVLRGRNPRVTMERRPVQIFATGEPTPMWTYGGTYPGPTIMRPTGRSTKVTFAHRLPPRSGSMSVHLHGDHHSSADDGQPMSHLIRRGESRTYHYPLRDDGQPLPGSTFWYHDHRMDRTGHNVWRGLQGMFLVTDPAERRLDLPRGRYDLPLMISERSFEPGSHRLTDPFDDPTWPSIEAYVPYLFLGPDAPPNDATLGDFVLVNGRYAPYAEVDAHRYRLRLVNGSNFTSYNFALSDGRPLTQIGTGNGLLPKPVERSEILLGPAQRADVVVDFRDAEGQTIRLDSVSMSGGSIQGIGPRPAQLMEFRVADPVTDETRVPARLLEYPGFTVPDRVAATWTFGLDGDPSSGTAWTINDRVFDPHRVAHTATLGTTEKWRLRNTSPITHYVHIHQELWRTISRDGKRPPPWERGYEDTWRLDPGETVEVAARFTDFPGKFMVHCHMLDHEDHGMMAQFRVVRPGSPTAEQDGSTGHHH